MGGEENEVTTYFHVQIDTLHLLQAYHKSLQVIIFHNKVTADREGKQDLNGTEMEISNRNNKNIL